MKKIIMKVLMAVIGFIKRLTPGIKQEIVETKEMFINLFKGNFKEAFIQFKDIIKMTVIFIIFMIPFVGGVLSTIILQKVKFIRPSAFLES